MLLLIFFLSGWDEPTQVQELVGYASFYNSGIMYDVAEYRGYNGNLEPVALMSCGDLGRDVWVYLGDIWIHSHSVDCAQENHYQDLVERERVVEVSFRLWSELDLPLYPVPAIVYFEQVRYGINPR